MNREIILKKCNKCGAICKIIRDCSCSDCEISCCGEGMNQVVLNYSEFAMEKHITHVEIVGDKIKVSVNHVMEEQHYIEWIAMVTCTEEHYFYFKNEDTPIAEFPYQKGARIYSYCNLHGLWFFQVD